MEDTKAIEFFQGVLSKTRAGRIRWQPTAEDEIYIAAIGGQFTLSVWRYERWKHGIALKDQEGRVLTTITSDDVGVNENDVRELYQTARRQALRVDDKIDKVLVELNKL
jgi:hypothetical protein